jgi:peptidoglycan/xylan/chitin deacetylase (PgdA/CDA1 family)
MMCAYKLLSFLNKGLRGCASFLRKKKKGRYEIVLYHFVSDRQNDFTSSGHTVTISEFRKQLKYLSENYCLVTLDQACSGLADRATEGPFASVCFDDGYRCILEEAYPVMEELRIKGTVFINPPVLGNRDLLWRDKIRYIIKAGLEQDFISFLKQSENGDSYNFARLSKQSFYRWSKDPASLKDMSLQKAVDAFFRARSIDAAALAAKYDLFMQESDIRPYDFLSFGNHTWSHPIMTLLDRAGQQNEIRKCHEYLVRKGMSPCGLALPFSPYDENTIASCRELRYRFLLTVYDKSNPLPAADGGFPLVLHRRMAPKEQRALAQML